MTLTRRDLLTLAAAVPAFSGLGQARLPKAASDRLPHNPAPDDEVAWQRIARRFGPRWYRSQWPAPPPKSCKDISPRRGSGRDGSQSSVTSISG